MVITTNDVWARLSGTNRDFTYTCPIDGSQISGQIIDITTDVSTGIVPLTVTIERDGVVIVTKTITTIGVDMYTEIDVYGDVGIHTYTINVIDNIFQTFTESFTSNITITCPQIGCIFTVI